MSYIVITEISKKQDYVFKSNKLVENIGASIVIKYITEVLPSKYLNGAKEIYKGGGKSIYIFNNKKDAYEFSKNLSRYVLKEFDGVELFITGQAFDYNKRNIVKVLDDVYKKLAIKKSERRKSAKIIGFGVNKVCASTNLPAYKYDSDGRLISKEIDIKQKWSKKMDCEFKVPLDLNGYNFPKELDDLGRKTEEKSYIAVIHIDGNKMGIKFEKFTNKFSEVKDDRFKESNDKCINELGNFSQKVQQAYFNAFDEVCRVIYKNIDKLSEDLDLKEGMLPIRPIILAGDDVCFVCDARISIECSRIFLESLSKNEVSGEKLNACAGIAIVKTHYPFSKAYIMAEELCSNCKDTLGDSDACLIDWHISQGEISGSLSDIRKQYYISEDGKKLTSKPLNISNYNEFLEKIKKVNTEDESNKNIARSKVKEIREVFKKGEKQSRYFIKSNSLEYIFGDSGFSSDGKCEFFDVIEVIDLFKELEG